MFKKNSPGCNASETCGCEGGGGCEYFADDFDRADDTDIGGDFTESAGAWSITSNQLVTSSANAICLLDTLHPDGTEESKVVVSATATASADLIRIALDYVDASNYHFAEWRIGTSGGYLRTYKRVAGVNTVLKALNLSRTVGAFNVFSACITPSGNFTASLYTGVVLSSVSGPITPHGGDQVGVATGATVTGTVKFDDFSASKINDDCPGCFVTCVECEDGNAPAEFKVSITGLTNFLCADCADLDGEYILAWTSGCNWLLNMPLDTPCEGGSPSSINISIADLGGAAGYTITLQIFEAVWSHSYGATKPDCTAIEDLAMTLASDSGPAGHCRHVSATCLLTAL